MGRCNSLILMGHGFGTYPAPLPAMQSTLLTPPDSDSSCEVLSPRRRTLDAFFTPKTVAVIGASETPGSVGRTILWNLISSTFGGTVFPVNQKRSSVLGIQAFPKVAAIPAQVDLAIVATP